MNLRMKPKELAVYIDHTLLKPDCSESAIEKLCEEAMQYGFASVCVPPFYVSKAVQLFGKEEYRPVKVITVVGYPFGYANTPAKVEEIKKAVDEGADEIDAVINICAVKNKHWSFVENDIDSMCTAARLRGKKIKIILETSLLSQDEIVRLMEILLQTQPDFVRASTGFNGADSSLETIKNLQLLSAGKLQLKASADEITYEQAIAFIAAGVTRIGTSSGVTLLRGMKG